MNPEGTPGNGMRSQSRRNIRIGTSHVGDGTSANPSQGAVTVHTDNNSEHAPMQHRQQTTCCCGEQTTTGRVNAEHDTGTHQPLPSEHERLVEEDTTTQTKNRTLSHSRHGVRSNRTGGVSNIVSGIVGGSIVAVACVAGLNTGLIGNGVTSSASSGTSQSSQLSITQASDDSSNETLAQQVASKSIPSVASIQTTTSGTGTSSTYGSSSMGSSSSSSIGSGSVLDTNGDIMTNYHVIEGASSITVSLSNKDYAATVIGYDESSDIAVIKIDPGTDVLTPIEIGDSDAMTVGSWVMSVGSPYGNEQSVSTGIVSSLYRDIALQSSTGTSIYANMIQTDAAINPGNSGGALVNSSGQLIGMNSIIESESGSSSGVGFAIPSNYAIGIAQQILNNKTVEHPYLGVMAQTVTESNAAQAGLNVSSGAYIAKITSGSPADAAGLKSGDVVTQIDNDVVTSADNLIIEVRNRSIGDVVTLTYVRNGATSTTRVTLGSDANASDSTTSDTTQGSNSDSGGSSFEDLLDKLYGNK